MACYGWDPVWRVSSNEILVAGDSGKLRIPGGEEKQIRYDIKNNGALPGSKHNVLAINEYSISGQHGVFILEESVAVASTLSSKKRRMIIAGAGFIVLLFFSRTNNRVSCSGKCCVKIRCCPAGEWRKLCGETGYGSIYQNPRWLELIGQTFPRLRKHRLACVDDSREVVWLLPLVEIKVLGKLRPMLISLPYGNYGGFLYKNEPPSFYAEQFELPLNEFFSETRALPWKSGNLRILCKGSNLEGISSGLR